MRRIHGDAEAPFSRKARGCDPPQRPCGAFTAMRKPPFSARRGGVTLRSGRAAHSRRCASPSLLAGGKTRCNHPAKAADAPPFAGLVENEAPAMSNRLCNRAQGRKVRSNEDMSPPYTAQPRAGRKPQTARQRTSHASPSPVPPHPCLDGRPARLGKSPQAVAPRPLRTRKARRTLRSAVHRRKTVKDKRRGRVRSQPRRRDVCKVGWQGVRCPRAAPIRTRGADG